MIIPKSRLLTANPWHHAEITGLLPTEDQRNFQLVDVFGPQVEIIRAPTKADIKALWTVRWKDHTVDPFKARDKGVKLISVRDGNKYGRRMPPGSKCRDCGSPLDAFGVCPQVSDKNLYGMTAPVYCEKSAPEEFDINDFLRSPEEERILRGKASLKKQARVMPQGYEPDTSDTNQALKWLWSPTTGPIVFADYTPNGIYCLHENVARANGIVKHWDRVCRGYIWLDSRNKIIKIDVSGGNADIEEAVEQVVTEIQELFQPNLDSWQTRVYGNANLSRMYNEADRRQDDEEPLEAPGSQPVWASLRLIGSYKLPIGCTTPKSPEDLKWLWSHETGPMIFSEYTTAPKPGSGSKGNYVKHEDVARINGLPYTGLRFDNLPRGYLYFDKAKKEIIIDVTEGGGPNIEEAAEAVIKEVEGMYHLEGWGVKAYGNTKLNQMYNPPNERDDYAASLTGLYASEPKHALFQKRSYVEKCEGHRNSEGELAEWCVKSHKDGHIISSHKSEAEAKEHLRQMEIHK